MTKVDLGPYERKPTSDEVDDAVASWHDGNADGDALEGMPLHKYLGWTEEEYKAWVADPGAIPDRPLEFWF